LSDIPEEIPFIAEVIQGGRITIPDEVREIFDIKEGYFVLCRLRVISRRQKKPRFKKQPKQHGTRSQQE
jgi:bifunctional DNA-binding transcriptional regulator/antitoxin component of YhaV-PrlF toxin-antitoxin module